MNADLNPYQAVSGSDSRRHWPTIAIKMLAILSLAFAVVSALCAVVILNHLFGAVGSIAFVSKLALGAICLICSLLFVWSTTSFWRGRTRIGLQVFGCTIVLLIASPFLTLGPALGFDSPTSNGPTPVNNANE